MKNLLIYINPRKDFSEEVYKNGRFYWKDETESLIKIQIDNSLLLGWKRKDILLVTNFAYEYNGIKATIVNVNNFCKFSPTASKINAIITLFEQGLENDLYWFHDNDAFQLENITEAEIISELDGADVGMTHYGITRVSENCNRRWSTGSMFFNKKAKDIFETIREVVYAKRINEEIALLYLIRVWKKKKKFDIVKRVKKIDITYNLATRKRNVPLCYKIAKKPLRVLHFHPFDKRRADFDTECKTNDNIAVCMYGKNKMNKVLMPKRLIKIFNKHGIC